MPEEKKDLIGYLEPFKQTSTLIIVISIKNNDDDNKIKELQFKPNQDILISFN